MADSIFKFSINTNQGDSGNTSNAGYKIARIATSNISSKMYLNFSLSNPTEIAYINIEWFNIAEDVTSFKNLEIYTNDNILSDTQNNVITYFYHSNSGTIKSMDLYESPSVTVSLNGSTVTVYADLVYNDQIVFNGYYEATIVYK